MCFVHEHWSFLRILQRPYCGPASFAIMSVHPFLCMSTACSWPGICSDLTKFLTQHIEDAAQKKKAMDQHPVKILRKFVKCAEDSTRSGACLLKASIVAHSFSCW